MKYRYAYNRMRRDVFANEKHRLLNTRLRTFGGLYRLLDPNWRKDKDLRELFRHSFADLHSISKPIPGVVDALVRELIVICGLKREYDDLLSEKHNFDPIDTMDSSTGVTGLGGRYSRLRRELLYWKYDAVTSRRLSKWTIPTDVLIPSDLLSKPVSDLIALDIDELYSKLGLKASLKLQHICKILERVRKDGDASLPSPTRKDAAKEYVSPTIKPVLRHDASEGGNHSYDDFRRSASSVLSALPRIPMQSLSALIKKMASFGMDQMPIESVLQLSAEQLLQTYLTSESELIELTEALETTFDGIESSGGQSGRLAPAVKCDHLFDRSNPERHYESVRSIIKKHSSLEEAFYTIEHWKREEEGGLGRLLLQKRVYDFEEISYRQLASRSGMGRKKLRMITEFLERAAVEMIAKTTSRREGQLEPNAGKQNGDSDESKASMAKVGVSSRCALSVGWEEMCATIVDHDVSDSFLGKFAESLQDLPTTYWKRKLSEFTCLSLQQLESTPGVGRTLIRELRDIVTTIYAMVSTLGEAPGVVADIRPQFASQCERELRAVLGEGKEVDRRFLFDSLLMPLMDQLRVDSDDEVVEIGLMRLGISKTDLEKHSVARLNCLTLEQIGNRLGVSRERARQRLVRIAEVFEVRWPEGEYLLDDFCEHVSATSSDRVVVEIVDSLFGLLFPVRKSHRVKERQQYPDRAKRRRPSSSNQEHSHSTIKGGSREDRGRIQVSAPAGPSQSTYIHQSISELLDDE